MEEIKEEKVAAKVKVVEKLGDLKEVLGRLKDDADVQKACAGFKVSSVKVSGNALQRKIEITLDKDINHISFVDVLKSLRDVSAELLQKVKEDKEEAK